MCVYVYILLRKRSPSLETKEKESSVTSNCHVQTNLTCDHIKRKGFQMGFYAFFRKLNYNECLLISFNKDHQLTTNLILELRE